MKDAEKSPAPYILYGATEPEDVMDALELIRKEWEKTSSTADPTNREEAMVASERAKL